MRIVLALGVACLLLGFLCIRLSIKAARIRPVWPAMPADRQPTPIPGDCEYWACGRTLTSLNATYCRPACRLADKDHGPNGDDQ
jgi:hypothetical protein